MPEAHVISSAAAFRCPRGQRGRRLGLDVGAYSRRPRAMAPDLTMTASWNGWWQPSMATPAFHTLHTLDGVASLARGTPSSSTSQRRRLTVDGELLWIFPGCRKWSRLLITQLQSARHVDRIFVWRLFWSTIMFKLRPSRAVFVTPQLYQLRAHARQFDRRAHNRCCKHRGNLRQWRKHRRSVAPECKQKQLNRKLDIWTWGGKPGHSAM